MATYQIMRRCPRTGDTSRWSGNHYSLITQAARYDHEVRGYHVTVIRSDNGNVVVFHGTNMADEMKAAPNA